MKNNINIESNPEFKQMIAKELAKYPTGKQQSAVFKALQWLQDKNGGYLNEDLMDQVADYLNMPRIAVYEIANFYSLYDLKPLGRHKVSVCNSISCMLCGGEKLLKEIEKKYGITPGETTKDSKFTLKEVECLGACIHAPVVNVDKTYHENITFEALEKIIEELE